MPAAPAPAFPPDSGLCRACRYARLVQSARGSVFVLCEAPPEFDLPKYPRLPVLACPAFLPPEEDTIEGKQK